MVSTKTIIGQLPAGRRASVEARAAEIVAEELTLRDPRRARGLRRARTAELLDDERKVAGRSTGD
jgi:hypothetical protein